MKEIKDYLHLYKGAMVQYKRFSEELQMYVLINPRELNEDCLLTIKMLYGENSLIDVKLFIRPLSDMSDEERSEYLSFWSGVQVQSRVEAAMKRDAEATKYLLSKHFDLFGLIEAGLALPLNTPQQ